MVWIFVKPAATAGTLQVNVDCRKDAPLREGCRPICRVADSRTRSVIGRAEHHKAPTRSTSKPANGEIHAADRCPDHRGPTGLVLALWLTKLGVKVRILDKTAEPGTTSRALAVQARTLELYRQLDLTEAVVARGHKVPAVNLWAKGEAAARLSFG